MSNKKIKASHPWRDEKLYLALPPDFGQKAHSTKVREWHPIPPSC